MATVHAAAGSTQGAQLWAEKTLGLDDGNPAALVVQAALAAEGGEADRAAELCKRALKRDPAYAPAHQLLKKLEGPKEASTKPEKPAGQPEEPAKEPEAPAEQPEEPAEEPEAPAEEPQ
jgi:predicted Zn-dependent protease